MTPTSIGGYAACAATTLETRSRISSAAVRGIFALFALVACQLPEPALAQSTVPMIYEDYGRCEAAFPDQNITSAAIAPFSCELTCGVDGVEQNVEVNDCKAQRLFQLDIYRTGAAAVPLLNLEYESVLDVLEEHELPEDDMDKIRRVMSYARGSVRAHVYANVVDIAAMDPDLRTADEQAIAEVYADEVHEMRIEAAQFSIDEFHRWQAAGCDYVAPEGFVYQADATVCDGNWTFNDLFETILPPTFEEFVQYGVASNFNALQEGNAGIATSEAAHGAQFIVVGVAAGIAIVATFIATATVIAAAGSVFPFIGTAAALAAATQSLFAALGATGAAAGAAVTGVAATAAIAISAGIVAVVAVVIAIFAGIIQGYYVFSAANLPDQLDEYLAQAIAERPFLAEVAANEAESNELFVAVMRSTLPSLYDLNSSSPPDLEWFARIPDSPGRSMVVTRLDASFNPIPGSETIVQSFQFMPWHGDTGTEDDGVVGLWSAEVSGGWFVLSRPIADQTATAMRLAIDRLGGDNTDWVTWIVGERFLSHPRGGTSDSGELSDTMFFWTPEGEPRLLSFAADPTPPEVTPLVDGTPGNDGWYVSDVDLAWDIFEPDSVLAQVSGCENATVASDGIQSFSCAAESSGGATSETITIKRDANPPKLSVAISPTPNAANWTNEFTSATFTCSDFGASGPIPNSICGGTVSVLGETDRDGTTFTRLARDVAGNEVTKSVTLFVDRTPPTISATSDSSPNALGWNNRDVTATFECEDVLSGIETCPGPSVLSAEGVNLSVGGTATDIAGNTAVGAVTGLKIDKTPPEILPAPSPVANGFGWNNTPVTVAFICFDPHPLPLNASGVKSCSDPVTLNSEGGDQKAEATARDNADNERTVAHRVNIDLTAPTIFAVLSSPANGNGWHDSDVTVSFVCNDALSGIDSCTGPSLLGEGAGQKVPGTAADVAGNTAGSLAGPINVDKTAPVIAIVSPPEGAPVYLQHEVVLADWSAGDLPSGIDLVAASAASGQPIDTSVSGNRRFEVSVTDFAGNSAKLGRDYVVLSPVEAIAGILSRTDDLVADGTLKAKQSKGLAQPLRNAVRSLQRGMAADACNQLADFVAEVEAKSPAPIEASTAASLIDPARNIATVSLGCAAS